MSTAEMNNTKSERMPVDSMLTMRVKEFALHKLNADLVGVANIERFENAPIRMSPQGVFPKARSVVVMAVHHPDAVIERDGREHPQKIGPYNLQGGMNLRLDEMSYRMARFLEEQGHDAVPIVSSNIWRYRGLKELKEQFAPDVSHMHAAVAAGLSEFGYNGLAITPEFGARQRYVTIITDAELTPTPLVEPGSVCDNCMLCAKHCLSDALNKEIDGWNVIRIEDKEYKYARKNLWRCAWGEHFGLDLDLEKPERVTEQVILEMVKKHGLRGGEMGSCLRHCVPKAIRYFDKDYTDAPRRNRAALPGQAINPRTLLERARARAAARGADFLLVYSVDELRAAGVNVEEYLPGCVSAVATGTRYVADYKSSGRGANKFGATGLDNWHGFADSPDFVRSYTLDSAAYDVARELERAGYDALPSIQIDDDKLKKLSPDAAGEWRILVSNFVLTNAPLPATSKTVQSSAPRAALDSGRLTDELRRFLTGLDVDMIGIASADRLNSIADALTDNYAGEQTFSVVDKGNHFEKFDPVVTPDKRPVLRPDDWMANARSVVLFGARFPAATVDNAIRTPSESVGPYAFVQYATVESLRMTAWRVRRMLEDRGFHAAWTFDLFGTGSLTRGPRGDMPDIFANSLAASVAGLGWISRAGFIVTPRFGPNIRFVALVTDAELVADKPADDAFAENPCGNCRKCLDACPTRAFIEPEISVALNGDKTAFFRVDRKRCDWAKRFSLAGAAGTRYMGWDSDVPVPDEITSENLGEALRGQPPILRHHPCNIEQCVLACPLARSQSDA